MAAMWMSRDGWRNSAHAACWQRRGLGSFLFSPDEGARQLDRAPPAAEATCIGRSTGRRLREFRSNPPGGRGLGLFKPLHRAARLVGKRRLVLVFQLFDFRRDVPQSRNRLVFCRFAVGQRQHGVGDDAKLLAEARDLLDHILLDFGIAGVVQADVAERPARKDGLIEIAWRKQVEWPHERLCAHDVLLCSPGSMIMRRGARRMQDESLRWRWCRGPG